ncbi:MULTISPECIES: hypothetical protein [Streptomyces]|uniref:Uncharacterized protein n=1 Tax=Streptomyces venezuelae (strain ATCC 10712 / CBS 650.69 / DSM 40230 / JCM 4526 / NBRC 13096 / PD 04745) TaxID=953739 RepID=F2RKX9_STRVP|nr:hypothetical protein [Streptomyces venezuelae]APE21350.1 hypothetical protein vnz_10180 [Streptomyces venezuelae]QER98739.1 hypothetical protein DEJ43_10305 [Streptomyces venezuelae ATCC 10712]CCA55368.1 hypothetical protein SVEN_2082 [Streptomyces venezuelae ATCC 10712]
MISTRPTVDAIEPAPGLLAYQIPGQTEWRLTHHSGLALAYCRDQQHAEDTARLIAGFTDWTRSADDIRGDETVAASLDELRFLISYEASATLPERHMPQLPATYTDADIQAAATYHQGDTTDGLAIISAMAQSSKFAGLGTDTFNEAFGKVMRIVHPEHYAA